MDPQGKDQGSDESGRAMAHSAIGNRSVTRRQAQEKTEGDNLREGFLGQPERTLGKSSHKAKQIR